MVGIVFCDIFVVLNSMTDLWCFFFCFCFFFFDFSKTTTRRIMGETRFDFLLRKAFLFLFLIF